MRGPLSGAGASRLRAGSQHSVAEHDGFFVVQLGLGLSDVGDFGRGGNNGVHEATVGIGADMRLAAEVSLVALARLAHVRISRTALVLRRARRVDQCGVDQRDFALHQATLAQMGMDLGKELLGQAMPLKKPSCSPRAPPHPSA